MATLVTKADLEAIRGPAYIFKLLSEAYLNSDTQPVKDQLALDRLNAVLADADALIRQYLDVGSDFDLVDALAKTVLLPIGRDEAEYSLKAKSRAGTDEEDEKRAVLRREVLAEMRVSKQWTANTAVQRPQPSETVPATSRFSQERLVGLV